MLSIPKPMHHKIFLFHQVVFALALNLNCILQQVLFVEG